MDNKPELENQQKPELQDEGAEAPKKLLELAEDEGELKRKAERRKKIVKEKRDWLVLIVCTLAAVFLVRSYVFEPIVVDGPSMNDTLFTGCLLYTSRCV